jgi:hypothetical protein
MTAHFPGLVQKVAGLSWLSETKPPILEKRRFFDFISDISAIP